MENEDAMIAIDREQLENLVSGKSIPDVKSIIIAQPPTKPNSMPLASTSNYFKEISAPKKESLWRYKGEDDEETDFGGFPSRKSTFKARRAVGKSRMGSRKVTGGLPETLKGLLGK